MENPKDVAIRVYKRALERHVRMPKIWDEQKAIQNCGSTVLLHKLEDGSFDENAALEAIIEKFGVEAAEPSLSPKKTKKRKEDNEEGEEKVKKPKKTEIVVEEGNRPLAEAIKEMADIYFKNKDARKGGVFSKAAKALRESETKITSAKEAMKLPGVGKGIAGYIQEKIDTGNIIKLEELRAGTA